MEVDGILDESAVTRLKRIGGVALAKQMIELFLQHGPERIGQAETGYAAGDLRMVEHAAHSMKSSAGNVGAVRLQAAASAVESATEANDDSTLHALVKAMRAEYDAASVALNAILAELT